jgi:signal transduction histidine kinase
VTALDGVEILFADRPEKEGLNLLQSEDPREAQVIREMIDLVEARGEGYNDYDWSRPGAEGLEFKKISYMKLFAPLQCFIGTGEYVIDMEADIQSEAMARLSNLSFGEEGYLFVIGWEGAILLGPVHGQNADGTPDPDRIKTIDELIRQARQGDGFIEYLIPKKAGGPPEPKISYVRGVPDWQWSVGTGVHIDDIERTIAQSRQAMLAVCDGASLEPL